MTLRKGNLRKSALIPDALYFLQNRIIYVDCLSAQDVLMMKSGASDVDMPV